MIVKYIRFQLIKGNSYLIFSTEKSENILEVFRNHSGPILSLDIHPEDFYKNTNVSKI